MSAKLLPVILCGGTGSRLWPVSRQLSPKPFMTLPTGRTLFSHTLERASRLSDEVIIVTNVEHAMQARAEVKEMGTIKARFILEPEPKNTAPAVLLSVLQQALQGEEDSTLLVMPSDHLIVNTDAFIETIARGAEAAEQDQLVIFGLTPSKAATGFGYIECGDAQATPNAFAVKKFIEKPNLNLANQIYNDGQHYWNTGIFCGQVKTFLKAFQVNMPEAVDVLTQQMESQDLSQDNISISKTVFAALPSISFDYAVLEKTDRLALVKAQFDWNDIGTWDAYAELLPTDEQGNQTQGDVSLKSCDNTFIHSTHRLTAALGVKDLIIVDTPDALLVASKDKSQEVKDIVSQLQAQQHESAHSFPITFRPWGEYTVLEQGPFFKIKRIKVNPEGKLSLQMHMHRNEHWVVVSGTATVYVDGRKEILLANQSTYIPAGSKHRLVNDGLIDLVMIEVQTGQYLGEDDIVRFDDHYGREVALSHD